VKHNSRLNGLKGRNTMDDKAPGEVARVGAVDVERFSHNVARMVEEGGKALAAYLKPREEGDIKGGATE
jgi:polyhydroxyalkanoate synthase subunit PhaC